MILIEPGATDQKVLEAALELVRALRTSGHSACISSAAITERVPRVLKFEAIADVRDPDDIKPDHVIVLNAGNVTGCALARLRELYFSRNPRLTAVGVFGSSQARIGAQSKIAFATGQEPVLVDLALIRNQPLVEKSSYLLFGLRESVGVPKRHARRLTIYLPDEHLEQKSTYELLSFLAHSPGLRVTIIISAAKKAQVQREVGGHISVYSYAEVQPEVLAKRSDVMAFLGKGSPGSRAASSAVHLMVNGGVVIDSTENGSLATSGAPVVRGPTNLSGLVVIVKEKICQQFSQISSAVVESEWTRNNLLDVLVQALDLNSPSKLQPATVDSVGTSDRQKIVIVPTNGVGLGHAQRSSLVAKELETGNSLQFAAFPGCVPMLRAKGFHVTPLVSKSSAHSEPYANDLMNYLRLRGVLHRGDRLVFDGAYIFDSIIRNVRELDLDATWIRRGLWQPGQIEKMPLEREREFNRVIVPGEAFGELNTQYTFGDHVRSVGPIVQIDRLDPEARTEIRNRISERFDRKIKKIIVTMLGGGVAADRSAQIQTLCALAESQKDWLHVMVVWPHATMSANLGTWRNSHVVRTQNALQLAQASDLAVSAAGYNSFHELLYHHVPTVFVPQMAGYMDDQERRARAASDRGLAVSVNPGDLLTLRQEVIRLLNFNRSSDLIQELESHVFPEIGNKTAARIVEESNAT